MFKSANLWYQKSDLARSIRLLSRNDQRKVFAVIIIQTLLSVLDLIGVALIGVIGALAIRGVSSQQPGDRVAMVLKLLKLQNFEFQQQVALLAFSATILLISRTILSVMFTRRTFHFLAIRGSRITEVLFSKVLSQSLIGIQKRSAQETLYAITNGVSIVVLGILGTIVSFMSDVSLLAILSLGVFLVDPTTAILAFLFFSALGIIMYKSLHNRVSILGSDDAKITIKSNEKILEVLGSYRENLVKNRRDFYVKEVSVLRGRLAIVQSELSFIPYISKYVIETSVVLGALLIAGFQFIVNDASRAVATLAIFLAAGTRIAPAVLRVQQSAILIRGNLAVAKPTLDLYEELSNYEYRSRPLDRPVFDHQGFIPEIKLERITFRYPNSQFRALEEIDLKVSPGELVVLVGASGAGKTTLVDLVLGVIEPESGTVLVSGLTPNESINKWPGAIGYVPQDVLITNSTVRENVTMGYLASEIDDADIWIALELAQLDKFVRELPDGLNSQVGDRGAKISGGQKQRLGIARALLSKPKLLILDEATSALDGETEASFSDAISNLRGEVTVILIAHRLSSVRNASRLVYLDKGQIVCEGDFDFIRKNVPSFAAQAEAMGL